MIDVTLTVNGVPLASKLSTYNVRYEMTYDNLITTMDGAEHGDIWRRAVITFSLIPMTDAQTASIFSALATNNCAVSYTDPHMNATRSGTFRLASDLDAVFGLRSIDGNRYYRGGEITLRSRGVL